MERELALTFPPDFLWGTAASAHRVEGGTENDWTDWAPGRVKDRTTSRVACDQYRRYRADFAQLASLGVRAHRLSKAP